jgi:hypothetical protein
MRTRLASLNGGLPDSFDFSAGFEFGGDHRLELGIRATALASATVVPSFRSEIGHFRSEIDYCAKPSGACAAGMISRSDWGGYVRRLYGRLPSTAGELEIMGRPRREPQLDRDVP